MDGLDGSRSKRSASSRRRSWPTRSISRKEDPKLVERYGVGDPKFRDDGAPRMVRELLHRPAPGRSRRSRRVAELQPLGPARRQLQELRDRKTCPLLDHAARRRWSTTCTNAGLDKDVSVVVWGEFGRTPKINSTPAATTGRKSPAPLLAGGGMRTGQVIGATNRLGEHADDARSRSRKSSPRSTTTSGSNLNTVREFDLRGRPQYLVDHGVEPMRELI